MTVWWYGDDSICHLLFHKCLVHFFHTIYIDDLFLMIIRYIYILSY